MRLQNSLFYVRLTRWLKKMRISYDNSYDIRISIIDWIYNIVGFNYPPHLKVFIDGGCFNRRITE
jgi:hypothetical protein